MDKNIYLGDPNVVASNVVISGLQIATSNSNLPNQSFNYLCDYNNRFVTSKATVSYDSIECSVTYGDTSNTFNYIAWLGSNDTTSLLWTDYKVEAVFNFDANNQRTGIGLRAQSIIGTFGTFIYFYVVRVDNALRSVISITYLVFENIGKKRNNSGRTYRASYANSS
eukprot:332549_1